LIVLSTSTPPLADLLAFRPADEAARSGRRLVEAAGRLVAVDLIASAEKICAKRGGVAG
jgi:hypothetical protein